MTAVGVDIVAIPRMRETLDRSGSLFLNRVFTAKEQDRSRFHPDRAVYYAELFAAKEAVFKTFRTGWTDGMSFLDIEIEKGLCGEPTVILGREFFILLRQKNAETVMVSLTWESEAAVAFAVMC